MKLCPFCKSPTLTPDWQCDICGKAPKQEESFILFDPKLAKNNDFFPNAESFRSLAKLEQKNYWFRARNKIIVDIIKKYCPHTENLLEIGCGTGFVLSHIQRTFPNMTIFGSEIYLEGLKLTSQRTSDKTSLYQMNALNIPFEKEFDLICMFDVLEHIDNDETVLSEVHRALKDNGMIFITVPQHQFLWSQIDEIACHKRRYSRKMLAKKLKNAGFIPIRTTSFVTLLFPLLLFSRHVKRGHGKNCLQELQIREPLNSILEKFIGIDRWLIKCGISLPFGGSLLTIAKKV